MVILSRVEMKFSFVFCCVRACRGGGGCQYSKSQAELVLKKGVRPQTKQVGAGDKKPPPKNKTKTKKEETTLSASITTEPRY